jgi:hypothetical protein
VSFLNSFATNVSKTTSAKEVERMKKLVLAMAFLALGAGVALAGPNAGLTLTPHGNVDGVETNGDPCGAFIPPGVTCEDTNPNAAPDPSGVEWYVVLAAGNSLAFNTIVFGVGDYDPYACYLAGSGPCFGDLNPLEVPSAGWPGPNSGTAVSWAPECLTGDLVPVYYFGFYVYYGGGSVPLGDFYPGQVAAVVSCESPPEEDLIADFGAIGCGDDPGEQACPDAQEPRGACCVDADGDGIDETCIPGVTEFECFEELGGSLWFPDTDCGPNNEPCPQPTPVQETTWGQIKSIYR